MNIIENKKWDIITSIFPAELLPEDLMKISGGAGDVECKPFKITFCAKVHEISCGLQIPIPGGD